VSRWLTPTRLAFPDITLTLPGSAPTWQDWHDDFLVKGNNTAANERQGTLTFLSDDLRHELGTLSLVNLGIVRLEPAESAGGRSSELRASLYCERIELHVGA